MKRIVVFFMVMVASVSILQAQSIRWGVSGGLNISEYSSSLLKSKAGFHIGPKAEISLDNVVDGLFINTGLLLTRKGAKRDVKSLGEIKLNPYFFEVPIHLGYRVGVSDKLSVFGDFGPYMALGLFGKVKAESNAPVGKKKHSYSEDVFGDDGVLKRFDMGLGIRAGFEFMNKYQLAVTYDWGLLKTSKNSDLIDSIEGITEKTRNLGLKNRNIMVSFSYMF